MKKLKWNTEYFKETQIDIDMNKIDKFLTQLFKPSEKELKQLQRWWARVENSDN